MENEGKYIQQPQQGVPEQLPKPYYGWQYEQDSLDSVAPSSPPVTPSISPAYERQDGQEPFVFVEPPVQSSLYGWQYEQEPSVSGGPPAPALPLAQEQHYEQSAPAPVVLSAPLQSSPYDQQYQQVVPISEEPILPVVPSQPLSGLPSLPGQSQHRSLRAYGLLSGPLPAYPNPSTEPAAESPVLPQYQEPLLDMGSTLSYGQGMEYQYFNAPQPSQSLPTLREARLRQLRSERMARQQSNNGQIEPRSERMVLQPPGNQADLTHLMLRRGVGTNVKPISGIFSQLRTTTTAKAGSLKESAAAEKLSALAHNLAQRLLRDLRRLVGQLDREPVSDQAESATGQMRVMARATMILTGSFIVGRVLGLIRSSLFAFIFGTSLLSDAYVQAFLVPDLIFNVVAGGALSSAFIPIFTQYMLDKKDEKGAWHIASSALNLALAIMCFVALIAMIFAPWLVPLYNPNTDAYKLSLIVTLTRLMLLQSIIMGGGVILSSVLYARQSFMRPAVGTVLYNVGLILGLIPGFFLTFFGRSDAQMSFAIYAATWGVILGAIFQVAIQIPGVRKEKMRYTFAFDWKHPGVRQIGRQMLPRALNAAALYFSTFVDRALLLMLAAGPLLTSQQQNGLVTQYYQAFQLVLLPLGIFGMAVSTAAFPTMAENVTLGRLDRVRYIIEETLRSIFFLSIPSSVGLIVLGLPIIQVLLQHRAFNLDSATGTSVPLAFFAIGLVGLASVEILTRSFYSFRDSKTPVIVSMAQFALKIVLSLILLNLFKWGPAWSMASLAFSTSVAGLAEAAVMIWLLQRKIGMLQLRKLANFAGRVLLASIAMGAGVLLLRTLLDLLLQTTISESLGVLGTIFAIFKLGCELSAGLLIYIWATRHLGIEDFWKQGPVRRVLDRFKLSWL